MISTAIFFYRTASRGAGVIIFSGRMSGRGNRAVSKSIGSTIILTGAFKSSTALSFLSAGQSKTQTGYFKDAEGQCFLYKVLR